MLQAAGLMARRVQNASALPLLRQFSAQLQSSQLTSTYSTPFNSHEIETDSIRWVFLGPPGVGKGTYASRIAEQLGVAHIATGDLVRAEMKTGSQFGIYMAELVNQGKLVPDDAIFKLLQQRIEHGQGLGERGYILDGFPRTRHQAEALMECQPVHLAVNLSLREDILVEKCLGRRLCSHCGKNYNIAEIYYPAQNGLPEVIMPPLSPPPQCAPFLEQRADDTEEVIRQRLKVYNDQAHPVEDFYRERGLLLDFEIYSGIPETLPRLLDTLRPYIPAAAYDLQEGTG